MTVRTRLAAATLVAAVLAATSALADEDALLERTVVRNRLHSPAGRLEVSASAGVTLVKGDLAGIARARSLSRATMRNIRQNLFLAFVYNMLGVPLAAGVLYPVLGILLSPIVAALAMALSSVSVIGNALRLRTLRL